MLRRLKEREEGGGSASCRHWSSKTGGCGEDFRRPRRGNICRRMEVLICAALKRAASQHGRLHLLQKRNGPELETLRSAIWPALSGRPEEVTFKSSAHVSQRQLSETPGR